MPQRAALSPSRARPPGDRPSRLRRLLCGGREARRPALRDRPVIIGGGRRGVVATACYVARISGVRSAMPMFTALKLCPEAIVIAPDMSKYAAGRAGGAGAHAGPHPGDRAAVDRRGLSRSLRHHAAARHAPGGGARGPGADGSRRRSASPSRSACRTTSSSPKSPPISTSRAASRRSAVAETRSFLAARPVSAIYGVGQVMQRELAHAGITRSANCSRWRKAS